MFKYSIRSELTRKYYERRIRIFFDFNPTASVIVLATFSISC